MNVMFTLGNSRWSTLLDGGKADAHVARWFKYCSGQKPFSLLPSDIKVKSSFDKGLNVSKEIKSDGKKVGIFKLSHSSACMKLMF